jgi:hypothetical protein
MVVGAINALVICVDVHVIRCRGEKDYLSITFAFRFIFGISASF